MVIADTYKSYRTNRIANTSFFTLDKNLFTY